MNDRKRLRKYWREYASKRNKTPERKAYMKEYRLKKMNNKASVIRDVSRMSKNELLFMVTLVNSFLCEKNGGREDVKA